MINRVILTGRLTADQEVKYTQSGTATCSFNLAVNRQFTNKDGKREADFIRCVIWRKSAENFQKFNHKGSLVGIEGRIQTRSYDNNQGQRVYVTEVVVDSFSLLESKNANHDRGSSNYTQSNANANGNYQSFMGGQQATPNFADQQAPSIDDVPF